MRAIKWRGLHAPKRQRSLASFSVSSGESGDAAADIDCEDTDCCCEPPSSSSSSTLLRLARGISESGASGGIHAHGLMHTAERKASTI